MARLSNSEDISSDNTQPRAWILALFFLSGVSGLIYEIIWVRMLTMFVGGSAFSVSIVLTVFMAGLALGSAISARLIDRINKAESLVFIYGLLEVGIGLCGILFPFAMTSLKPIYAGLYNRFFESLLGYNLSTSFLSVALLIIPTTLMGATLPVLCRYYIRHMQHVGTRTGRLYGLNTAGGAIGALLCGLWLIRSYGVNNSLAVAVGINFLAGFVCILASRPAQAWLMLMADLKIPAIPRPSPRNASSAVLIVLAASGFCSMSYEVIWTKLLSLLVGPTTYSFTIVLFTFITGLALGSIIFGWVCDHTRKPFLWLIMTQFAASGLALWVSHLLGNSQVFFAKLIFELKGDFLIMELAKGLSLFAFMLLPTLCLGAVFPIANKIHTDRLESVGSSVGRLYAVNTVGALLGSFCAGFFLVPFLGKATSLSGLAALQACAALAACLVFPTKRRTSLLFALPVAVVLLTSSFYFPRWDRADLAKAKYHRLAGLGDNLNKISFVEALTKHDEAFSDIPDLDEMLFIDDGIGGFVAVGESVSSLGVTNRYISISGKIDTSSYGDLHTMTLSGQVPMLFHSNAVDVMVVGLASGITAGEMLYYPLEQLDILEISPEVVEACRFFAPWNNNVLSDPRARIIMQDARTHLALTDSMYDVIMSEPSNPWMAGVANLFTLEYFQKVRGHLKPGGIFVQWIQTYQTDWDSFSMVVRTLNRAFPAGAVLLKTSTVGTDYLIVCAKDGHSSLDLNVAENNMQFAARSKNMRMSSPKVLYPLIMSEDPARLCGDGPIHTDSRPRLEYISTPNLYTGGDNISSTILERRFLSETTKAINRQTADVGLQLAFADFMASMNIEPFGLVHLPSATPEQKATFRSIIADYCKKNMVARYETILNPGERDICLAAHEEEINRHIQNQLLLPGGSTARLGQSYYDLGNVYGAREEYGKAIECYTESLARLPSYGKPLQNLLLCYERSAQFSKAIDVLNRLLSNQPESPMLISRLAANYLRLKDQDRALALFMKAIEIDRNFSPALVALGGIHGTKGNYELAIQYSRDALQANPRAVKAYQNIVLALVRLDRYKEALMYTDAGLSVDPGNEILINVRPFLTGTGEK